MVVFVVENRVDSPEISPQSVGVGASRQDKMQWRAVLAVICDLPHCRLRLTCDLSCSYVSLMASKAVFVGGKRVE